MTHPLHLLDTDNISWDTTHDMILEIGSERGEGSTSWLSKLAWNHGIPMYSVDVSDSARNQAKDLRVHYQVYQSGSAWCREILPTLVRKIKLLYLDNFDWNYDIVRDFPKEDFENLRDPNWTQCVSWDDFYQLPESVQKECVERHGFNLENSQSIFHHQILEYRSRGIEMNNRNSAREHLAQAIYCSPYLAQDAVVICDDTWIEKRRDCWMGKSMAVIPYLETQGFSVIGNRDNAVVLTRT